MIYVDDIVSRMAVLFKQYKIRLLTQGVFLKYMHDLQVPKTIQCNNEIDNYKFIDMTRQLYWAIASVQFELGYMLIALESNKKNIKDDDDDNLFLSHMDFIHHYFLSTECLYKVWERFAVILNYIHTKQEKKNGYYANIINEIEKSKIYDSAVVKKLKKHQKQWDKIAEDRNNVSHEYSSLIHGMESEVTVSPIRDFMGNYIFKIEDKKIDLKNHFISIKNKFYQLEKLDSTVYEFIDSLGS